MCKVMLISKDVLKGVTTTQIGLINLLMRYSGIENRLTEKDPRERERYSEEASRI